MGLNVEDTLAFIKAAKGDFGILSDPIHRLCENRNMPALEWFVAQDARLVESVYLSAASTGDMDMLRWARGHGARKHQLAFEKAILGKRIDIMKDFMEGKYDITQDAQMVERVYMFGALGGAQRLVQWAKIHGARNHQLAFETAIVGNHVDIVKDFVVGERYVDMERGFAVAISAGGKSLDVAKYLVTAAGLDPRLVLCAVVNGLAKDVNDVDTTIKWVMEMCPVETPDVKKNVRLAPP